MIYTNEANEINVSYNYLSRAQFCRLGKYSNSKYQSNFGTFFLFIGNFVINKLHYINEQTEILILFL